MISYRAVPELEELLSQKEYEEEGQTVSILELNVADLEQGSSLIGENEVEYEGEDGGEVEQSDNKNSSINDEIPGMELKQKPEKKLKQVPKSPEKKTHETSKNIKKAIKRKATKEVQKSKVFQQKQKIEHLKNKKKMRQKLKMQQKFKKRETRGRKKV